MNWRADKLLSNYTDHQYNQTLLMAVSYREQLESLSSQNSIPFTIKNSITSLIESLYTEANESPFSLRRYKLALQYYTKFISCPLSPTYYCNMQIKYKNLFENKPKAIKPLNRRVQNLLNEIRQPTNSQTRTNQIIQNLKRLHHFPRKIL